MIVLLKNIANDAAKMYVNTDAHDEWWIDEDDINARNTAGWDDQELLMLVST